MRSFFLPCDGKSNLSAGEWAEPGLYVVVHRDPPHRTPHEILIESPMRLPPCKSCFDVQFNFKSSLPCKIEQSGIFAMESRELIDEVRAASDVLNAMRERSSILIKESRDLLSRYKNL